MNQQVTVRMTVFNGVLRLVAVGWLLGFSLLLSGCITTVEGNIIEEGSVDERLQANLDLARGYLSENKFQRARRPLNRALEINNRSVQAHVLKAIIHQRENENDLAEKHFKLALKYDSKNAQALNNYGGFLFSQGRAKAAAKPLRAAVKDTSYSARPQAFVNLGLVELALANVDDAREAFERSLMLNSKQYRAHLELADMYFDKGNYVRSAQHYAQFRKLARQTPRSLCLGVRLGDALEMQDDVSSYRMALKNLYPGSPEAKRCVTEDVAEVGDGG